MYRLIIVDDEAFILEQLHRVFRWDEMGFALAGCFTDANEAIKCLRSEAVDVLLTDIQLGSDTGIRLCAVAREVNPQIELVLLSAYSDFDYAHSAIRLNVHDYLLKPVTYSGMTECFAGLKAKLDQRQAPVQREPDVGESPANYRIELVKRYTDKHLGENLTLEMVADSVSMNAAYFSRFFKRHTGEHFADYLAARRVERAIELLRDPSKKVFEISLMVGYYSKQNFYKRFRQYTGHTPEAYRNEILKVREPDDET